MVALAGRSDDIFATIGLTCWNSNAEFSHREDEVNRRFSMVQT